MRLFFSSFLRAEDLFSVPENIQLMHYFHFLCGAFCLSFFLELMFFSSAEYSWIISVAIFSPPIFLKCLLLEGLVG